MTQEEKDLLLKYLCAAAPHGLMMDRLGQPKKLVAIHPFSGYCIELGNGEYMPQEYTINDAKPYLRPMSSMTDEERAERVAILYELEGHIEEDVTYKYQDWLLAHHLDFMGLIPKDCAIDCTNLNVY